jgi:cytochrome c556
MKYLHRIALVTAVAAISAAAVAQTVTKATSAAEAQKAIEARQQIYKEIKKANDPVAAMLRGQAEFDTAVVGASAARIQQLAGQIPAAFTLDTHEFKDIKTAARDAIWAGPAAFKTKAEDLAKAAGNVVTVAKGGDKAATRMAVVEMSKTCGSCHDDYKIKL